LIFYTVIVKLFLAQKRGMLMKNYELIYNGKDLRGLVERFARDANYFLRESEILEEIEHSLSHLISKSIEELNPEVQRGQVWLCRFNAREKGQDAFYVQFNPSRQEQTKVRFVQTAIAEGRFLTKEIRFFKRDICISLPYIEQEFIPFLKAFFTKLGFKVLEEDKPFSNRDINGR